MTLEHLWSLHFIFGDKGEVSFGKDIICLQCLLWLVRIGFLGWSPAQAEMAMTARLQDSRVLSSHCTGQGKIEVGFASLVTGLVPFLLSFLFAALTELRTSVSLLCMKSIQSY